MSLAHLHWASKSQIHRFAAGPRASCEDVRAGKVIEIDFSETDPVKAAAEEMVRKLLANTVIESFRVSVEG
jgi:phosphoribosylformylglycinamidine (FGAM) synthase PurS component